jgi:hypothetical protein
VGMPIPAEDLKFFPTNILESKLSPHILDDAIIIK